MWYAAGTLWSRKRKASEVGSDWLISTKGSATSTEFPTLHSAKADAPLQVIERKVGAEIEHKEG